MKLDMRYKRFQYLINKIHEAEKMSADKQDVINQKKATLREETRIIVVEEGKEEIARLEAEKVEFDKMTQMAVARARTELEGLRSQIEEEYNAKLLKIMEGRSKIGNSDLSADSINEIENIIKRDTELLQREVAEQRKYIDLSSKDLELLFNPELIKDELAKAAEPKAAEPKAGEPKEGEPKAGEPKEGEPKAGEPKEGEPKAGEPKAGEPKEGEPKEGEPQAGEPKEGEPKAGEPKEGEPKEGEPKAGEPKAGEPKAGEPKEGEPKEGEPKEGEPKPDEPKKDDKKTDPAKLGVEVKGLKGILLSIVRWLRDHSKDGSSVARWCDSMDARISASIKALPVGASSAELANRAKAEASREERRFEKEQASRLRKDRKWIKARMKNSKGDRQFKNLTNFYYNQVDDELEANNETMKERDIKEEVATRIHGEILRTAKKNGIECKDKDGYGRPVEDIYKELCDKLKTEAKKNKQKEPEPEKDEGKPEAADTLARQFDKDWIIDKMKAPGDDELFTRLGAHIFDEVKKENMDREEKWSNEEFKEQCVSRIEAEILREAEKQGIPVKFRNDTRRPIQDIYAELAEKIRLQKATDKVSKEAADKTAEVMGERQADIDEIVKRAAGGAKEDR